eukprot:Skav204290  [mRNA]  locus=scaffold409:418727:419113:- [translate_table: standard]
MDLPWSMSLGGLRVWGGSGAARVRLGCGSGAQVFLIRRNCCRSFARPLISRVTDGCPGNDMLEAYFTGQLAPLKLPPDEEEKACRKHLCNHCHGIEVSERGIFDDFSSEKFYSSDFAEYLQHLAACES